MIQNLKFSLLFIFAICFLSKPSSVIAETVEACGLEKKDLGRFVRVPSGFFIKNQKPLFDDINQQHI